MFRLLLAFFLTLSVGSAHLGYENETEVRVFPDHMRVVLRTSIPFAWRVLGDGAPFAADEAGRSAARPLLIDAAPSLLVVSAGGVVMDPMRVNAGFEVHDDVAFVYHYPRPEEWPVTIEARYFPALDPGETGLVTVYDSSESRFARDLEPLLRKAIDGGHPAVSFTLAGESNAAVTQDDPSPQVAEEPVASPWPASAIAATAAVGGLLVVVGAFLIVRRRKRASR